MCHGSRSLHRKYRRRICGGPRPLPVTPKKEEECTGPRVSHRRHQKRRMCGRRSSSCQMCRRSSSSHQRHHKGRMHSELHLRCGRTRNGSMWCVAIRHTQKAFPADCAVYSYIEIIKSFLISRVLAMVTGQVSNTVRPAQKHLVAWHPFSGSEFMRQ